MKSLRVFLGILFASLLAARPAIAPPTFTGFDTGGNGYEVRWGDCNNDGHLDFCVAGVAGGARFVRVYLGNGAGSFTLDPNSNAMFGMTEGPCIWGDYDNDGDLDLAFAGWNGTSYSRIYRNDGAAGWTDIGAGLRGVKGADGAWFDYDNDGDLDLLLTGESYDFPSGDYTLIYRNDHGTFVQAVSLLGTYIGAASIGDYDHDGDLDLALTGRTVGTRIYRNDGNGAFTDIAAGLPVLLNSSIAWGDFDNDGDLDLALSGEDGGAALQADIYRNDNGTFVAISSGITPVRLGHITWGDYDNDGNIDLLMVGTDSSFNPLAFVLRNNGNGTFSDAAVGLTGVGNQSSADWGDYDNDGDLDILIGGDLGVPFAPVTLVYTNNSSVANTAPSNPTGLSTTVVGGAAQMKWNASTDAQTPAAGLTYNLRVGTSSGGQQVMTPMSNLLTGKRRIPARGNAQHNLDWTLKNLPSGTYYWSVQAVDNGYLGSGWSPEATFTIVPPPGAFTLLLPADGGVDVPTRPQFTWSASAVAASYRLQVATDAGFAFLVLDESGILGTSFMPAADLLPATPYHWRVTAVNTGGTTLATGAPFSLTTRAAAGPAVTNIVVTGGGCGLLGLEVLILLALRRLRFRR